MVMKLGWHKFKSPSMDPGIRPCTPSYSSQTGRRGSSPRECSKALTRASSVSQEYKAALRTNSYAELWSKVQSQLTTSSSTGLHSSPSSRSNIFIARLSETLLEPGRETLAVMIETLHLHHLLVDYFEASSEACDACELLLLGLHQTRANYKRIRRVIKLADKAQNRSDSYTDSQCQTIYRELGSFSALRNPLSAVGPVRFHEMTESYAVLLHGIIEKRERIRAKARLAQLGQRASGCCLMVSCAVLGIASVVLAVHGAVAVVAAPGLITPCFGLGFFSKKKKKEKLIHSNNPNPNPNPNNNTRSARRRRLTDQLDVAAKGLYVLINDMGTMGSLVGRLQDEVEHAREWAGIGFKNEKSDKILKEVVRELDLNSLSFMEQLDELEEHVYLCLLTINKSRRSLLEEILVVPSSSSEDDQNNINSHSSRDATT